MIVLVAFIRAVNVGGNTVKMDHLRELFLELGLANPRTFIASGNVIFETAETDFDALGKRITEHLSAALGFSADTFLRTAEEAAALASLTPFPAQTISETDSLHAVMLNDPPSPETVEKLLSLTTEEDLFAVHGREVWWLCRGSVARSKAGVKMGKVLGVPSTARSVKMLRRLSEQACSRG